MPYPPPPRRSPSPSLAFPAPFPHNRSLDQTAVRSSGTRGQAMGIEGRERQRTLEAGAQVLSGQLGKTIQRLRKAYNLSLSELAEQSGVAKSIISQIERNETNPTLATIWRLSQALDVSIERVLATQRRGALHREDDPRPTRRSSSPTTARCGSPSSAGSRPSSGCNGTTSPPIPAACSIPTAHQRGSVECLSVLEGEFEVEVGGVVAARQGRRDPALPLRPAATSCAASANEPGARDDGLHPQGGGDGVDAGGGRHPPLPSSAP